MRPRQVDAAAREYLRDLPVRAPLVTDRSLSNYLNLGLIKLLFPAARVVHLTRDPRDVALSIYFTDFAHGHGYAFDLQHLAAHFDDYRRLMAHWRSLWPDHTLELSYESLVSDFDSTLSTLLAFLGVSNERPCGKFFERRNPVEATRSWAVRQPLYDTSIGRWRNYRDHLVSLADLSPLD